MMASPKRADPIFGARPKHELEFLPAALELIETPPPPLPRITALALLALIVVALLWAGFSQIDIVTTASGRLVPAGGSKVIQPLEAGTVVAINVHDGMTVHQGDKLIELEPTETVANQARASGELAATELDVARLKSVALGASFRTPQGADRTDAMIAKREATAEINERNAKVQNLEDEVDQHRAALAGAQAEILRLKALLPLAQQRAAIFQSLVDHGYGSKLQLIEAQEKVQDTANTLQIQARRVTELAAQIAASERARDEAKAAASKTALGALSDASVKASSQARELDKAVERRKGRTLTAPVDGTVQELALHTIGGVVQPGQTLLRIAPSTRQLEVEARLANKDVGFIRAGMSAEIKVETFPFTRYGLIHGKVLSISRDVVTDPRPDPPTGEANPVQNRDLTYLLRLSLDRNTIDVDGKTTPLSPGMIVLAEIKTGKRRVIDYILSPVEQMTSESARER